MNTKRFLMAFIAAFVFVFLFGYAWYGNLMHGIHGEVPAIWRSDADFNSHFPWLILGHAVMAFFLTMIFASFAAGGGARAGVRLGILVAFLYIGDNLISFAVMPLTPKILCGWILGNLLQFAIAGAIIGAIYKPNSTATST